MVPIFKKAFFILCLASIFACDVDSNCGSVNVDFITFSTVTLNANLEERNVQVFFDSIVSPQTDSVFVELDTIGTFSLPLSPVTNETDFFFYFTGSSRVDSIRFTYDKINRVDSPECGIDMEFVGIDTVFQSFDSMVIVNDTLKRTVNAPNIKLFIF